MRSPPQTELLLAGDFVSPTEVLGSNHLTTAQKREILNVWRRDLLAKPHLEDARSLLASVRLALESLDAQEQQEKDEEQ